VSAAAGAPCPPAPPKPSEPPNVTFKGCEKPTKPQPVLAYRIALALAIVLTAVRVVLPLAFAAVIVCLLIRALVGC